MIFNFPVFRFDFSLVLFDFKRCSMWMGTLKNYDGKDE